MSTEAAKTEEKPQQKISVQPYLTFGGKASEAMDFYAEHLDAKIDCKMLFSQGPPPILEEFKDCVMHGSLSFDGNTLMFSDAVGEGCGGPITPGNNVTINLCWTDLIKMTKAFEGLSAGGKVTMPLDKQFWGATYGSFVDKFDIPWSFNYQHEEPAEKKQRVD